MKIKQKMIPEITTQMLNLSAIIWEAGIPFKAGYPAIHNGDLYACSLDHISGESFESENFTLLVKGGIPVEAGYSFTVQAETVTAPAELIITNDISGGGPRPFILKKINTAWEEAVQEIDYTLSFKEDLSEMTVNFLIDGDYRINY